MRETPNTELRVRATREADTELVADILGEAVAWMQSRNMSLWRPDEIAPEAITEDVKAGRYRLAFEAEQAVATLKYLQEDPSFWPEAEPGEAAYLHRIAVRRAFAGGAVSSRILSWASEYALEQGKRYLRLDCAADRQRLRAVYEGLGFRFHSEKTVGKHRVVRLQLRLT